MKVRTSAVIMAVVLFCIPAVPAQTVAFLTRKTVQFMAGCVLIRSTPAADSLKRCEQTASLSTATTTTATETLEQIQTIRKNPSDMADLVRGMREALEGTRE